MGKQNSYTRNKVQVVRYAHIETADRTHIRDSKTHIRHPTSRHASRTRHSHRSESSDPHPAHGTAPHRYRSDSEVAASEVLSPYRLESRWDVELTLQTYFYFFALAISMSRADRRVTRSPVAVRRSSDVSHDRCCSYRHGSEVDCSVQSAPLYTRSLAPSGSVVSLSLLEHNEGILW